MMCAMSLRGPIAVGLAIVALLAAACEGLPPDDASARTVASTPATSPAPTPREFLEIGLNEPADMVERSRAHEADEPAAGRVQAPRSLKRWAWTLQPRGSRLAVWSDPRPKAKIRKRIDAENPWGQRIAFPVMAVEIVRGDPWYRVLLGIEPNGSNGWVRARDVVFVRVRHRVTIDLSERILRHYRNGRLRHRFSVGIGARGTPTSAGRFFVWARLHPSDPAGPYGSFLLGLSGFSDVLTDWPGGGRLAIHGTADPSDRGRRVSHGCTRVFNPQMDRLRDIPMGTTVTIRR
jgi:hypothetical protein